MCTLCLNQRPLACLAKIKTFTNSDLSHCEAMTSFIPHLGPCHLVTLVEPITDGRRHTVTSQFQTAVYMDASAVHSYSVSQAAAA